ncbi:DUF5592 family protein [Bacillus licheniformis]|nr:MULTISPECIES: DUF5592 family protein [Bacillus]ASK26306.1 hypothetical protein BSSX_p0115 [Bacillus subtilis]MCA1183059.1 DUF5592 family protein [Bacillus licheniformis]MCQ5304499.1 DUF5592 family protein [Bacillus licheniformis]MDM5287344.1 DUF5592 family protein [Bacillus licheniformis]MDN5389946.1 DUF5592 family protein [Bacillus sp. LB7]
MSYPIPKEVKTDIKVKGFLYLKDVGILTGVLILSETFKGNIHTAFLIPYYIFTFSITIFLILPSIKNPKKKNFHSIYYALKRSRKVYHSLDRRPLEDIDELYESIGVPVNEVKGRDRHVV